MPPDPPGHALQSDRSVDDGPAVCVIALVPPCFPTITPHAHAVSRSIPSLGPPAPGRLVPLRPGRAPHRLCTVQWGDATRLRGPAGRPGLVRRLPRPPEAADARAAPRRHPRQRPCAGLHRLRDDGGGARDHDLPLRPLHALARIGPRHESGPRDPRAPAPQPSGIHPRRRSLLRAPGSPTRLERLRRLRGRHRRGRLCQLRAEGGLRDARLPGRRPGRQDRRRALRWQLPRLQGQVR